jgi:hypothetical protein
LAIVDPNPSDPDVTLVLANEADNEITEGTKFTISFANVDELTSDGRPVTTSSLANQTYAISRLSKRSGSTSIYSYTLPNGALVEIFSSVYDGPTEINVDGDTIQVGNNSIKHSVRITNWPFTAVSNMLRVKIYSTGSDNYPDDDVCCKTVEKESDQSGNLRWLQVTLNGVSLYTNFFDEALVDGKESRVKYAYNENDQAVTVAVPQFWDQATFTTISTFLTKGQLGCSASCSNRGNSKAKTGSIVGGVIGGVAGAALIGGAAAFLLKKRRNTDDDGPVDHFMSV